MTETEVASLATDELIALVLQLAATNEGLREENAQLRAQVAELETKLNRPPKTPKNSSVPPSAGRKANRRQSSGQRSNRKRGARGGHKGTSRRRAELMWSSSVVWTVVQNVGLI